MRRSLRDPAWLAAVTARRAPPFTADLRVWVDPDDIDGVGNAFAVDDPIGSIVNKGSLGGTFDGATGARPTFRPVDGAGGGPCMRFSAAGGTGMASTLASSSFAFMHDGSGCTIYSVIKTTTDHYGTVCATSGGGGIQRGMGHRITTAFRFGYYMSDGVALRINANSTNFSPGAHHLLVSRLLNQVPSDLDGFIDGATAVFGTINAAAFSLLTPWSTLCLGRTPLTATNRLVGDLGDVLIYAAFHDDTQRAAVESWLASRRGAFPQ